MLMTILTLMVMISFYFAIFQNFSGHQLLRTPPEDYHCKRAVI